jgi:DNA-binding MarR family transcriptional regulator
MVHDNSNASRLVDKLITKGLVQRKQSTKDKRQVEVSITSKGEELLHQIETTIQEWEKSNEHLNQEDSLRLIELTQKLPNFQTQTEY